MHAKMFLYTSAKAKSWTCKTKNEWIYIELCEIIFLAQTQQL
jgi:hypothetical protein